MEQGLEEGADYVKEGLMEPWLRPRISVCIAGLSEFSSQSEPLLHCKVQRPLNNDLGAAPDLIEPLEVRRPFGTTWYKRRTYAWI